MTADMEMKENNESEGFCPLETDGGVYRTLEKIRIASYRLGFNLREIFYSLDPHGNLLISRSKFLAALSGPLKMFVGVSDEELDDLCQYYRVASGQIQYKQFVEMVHSDSLAAKKPTHSPDDYIGNNLSAEDEKRVRIMLTKIATTVTKAFPIRPFFQDYRLEMKEKGLITKMHFHRLLKHLGVELSPRDFILLVRKYARDSSCLGYGAFLKDIKDIREALAKDVSKDDEDKQLPGRLENVSICGLPRPEIIPPDEGPDRGLAGLLRSKGNHMEVLHLISKIRGYLRQEKIRIGEFLELYDPSKCGRISKENFQIAIDSASRSPFGNFLYITTSEMEILVNLYLDPSDSDRVLWRVFVRDIEEKFHDLDKWRAERCKMIRELCEQRQRGNYAWQLANTDKVFPPPTRNSLFTEIINKTKKREYDLKPAFQAFDPRGMGSITREQFRIGLIDNALFLTDEELLILEEEFGQTNVILYEQFIIELAKFKSRLASKEASTKNNTCKSSDKERAGKEREGEILEVLAKLKNQVICLRKNTRDLLEKLDPENIDRIPRNKAKSILEKHGFTLTASEWKTFFKSFSKDNDTMAYNNLCACVDEMSQKECLQGVPLKELMARKSAAQMEAHHPFMNHSERVLLSVVMKKLSSTVSMEHMDLFKEADREKSGCITHRQLTAMFLNLGVLHKITVREFDILFKGFGIQVEGPHPYALDYVPFLKAIDIVRRTTKAAQVNG